MNAISLFSMEKDRGYAWVILGASTILMCIGPSTYSSFGFLISDAPMTPVNQLWTLNMLYGFWSFSAFIAALYGKQKPRQLATTGSALAAIGFLISASTVEDPSWFYLTFSIFIGFGLGVSFHTAYLVAMSNFDQYKGLANGVCQLSIAIGQITTPFLFTVVSMPQDRFQIKALTTAIGFLTTLFFVHPINTVPRQQSFASDRNRRYSTTSRRGSRGESVPLQISFLQSTSNSTQINQGQMRPRRRSQYLLAVSTTLLPNIPEEPESTSMNDTLTSASSDSEIRNLGLASQSVTVLSHDTNNKDISKESQQLSEQPSDNDNLIDNNPPEIKVKDDDPVEPAVPKLSSRRKSEGSLPSYFGAFTGINRLGNGISNSVTKRTSSETDEKTLDRRYSESQLQSNSTKQINLDKNASKSQEGSNKLQNSGKTSNKGESTIDLSLLQDFHFLNMAAFSALCTVTVANFPVILYAYVTTLCADCTTEANIALLIIYIVDLISRLVISYLSDYPILSRRTAFLIGCGCGGILIAATSAVKDISLIYCICVAYGLCLGMLVTSEYVMFIDSFGHERFSQAYGFLNFFKLLVIILLGLFVSNPLAGYVYQIHPLDQGFASRNNTLYCDPLGLAQAMQNTSLIRLILNVAVPSILCAVAWITEDIYKASHRCSAHAKTSSQRANTDVP